MQPLASNRWQYHNRELLNQWLSSPKPHRNFEPCAVFDFDNTCIFGDIGDQTFYHQLETLQIAMTPAQLDAAGEAAFQAALKNEPGTKLDPAGSKTKKADNNNGIIHVADLATTEGSAS